jgi:hypothetical protein
MMPVSKRGGVALLSALAAGAVLAPVRFSTAEALAPSTAECTTCCTKQGTLCVVCEKTCITVPDAYDNGGGPCATIDNPNIT